jgi:hypothetical protein
MENILPQTGFGQVESVPLSEKALLISCLDVFLGSAVATSKLLLEHNPELTAGASVLAMGINHTCFCSTVALSLQQLLIRMMDQEEPPSETSPVRASVLEVYTKHHDRLRRILASGLEEEETHLVIAALMGDHFGTGEEKGETAPHLFLRRPDEEGGGTGATAPISCPCPTCEAVRGLTPERVRASIRAHSDGNTPFALALFRGITALNHTLFP